MRVLDALASEIGDIRLTHPVRVAIDGVDAAGKTTFRDALADALEQTGRTVIRASADGFHHPAAWRYRRGELSPEGYYLDSFDYDALRSHLLDPLGPGGDRRYRTVVFDVRADSPVDSEVLESSPDAILLVDGIFLLRPELIDCWDFSIFLHADFETTLDRASRRDAALYGGVENTRRRYLERYIPGQQLYLVRVQPMTRADAVVDNNDFANPLLIARHP